MLSRNNLLLRATDENGGQPTDTPQDNKGKEAPKTYTQEEMQAELSRIAAKEKREGKQAAEKAFLEALGVSNLDEIKLILETKKKEDESKKTELQKLQDALALKDKEILEAKQLAEKAETQRRLDNRNSQLRNLLLDAHKPETALREFLAEHEKDASALVDESGQFDNKEAEKLINDFRGKNAYLFKGNSKGSPSNSEGRLLKPDSEVKKELQADIQRKLKW